MKKIFKAFNILALAALILSCNSANVEKISTEDIKPPSPEKVPRELDAHGNKRTDHYYWMKLSEDQKNAIEKDDQTKKVLDYLTAENNYLEKKLKHTEGLQERLYNEIVGRIRQNDESVPYQANGYWYYDRYEEGKEYPIYCRKRGSLSAPEQIILNVNELAQGHDYFQVADLTVSEDNHLLAYGVDTVSRRRYTIYLKDLRTNKIVDTPVPNTEGYVAWANDNKTFFYTMKDSVTLRSDKIYRHKVGSGPSSDVLVYKENDESFYTGIGSTGSQPNG